LFALFTTTWILTCLEALITMKHKAYLAALAVLSATAIDGAYGRPNRATSCAVLKRALSLIS
jgi:hypothetical protein